MSLEIIKDVEISEKGRFKYILIKVKSKDNDKIILRGFDWAGYHADIYDHVEDELKSHRFDLDCIGGGRILHEPDKKSLFVYGYSQGFGRADHQISVNLLKAKYPDYSNIEFSNEGY